MKKTGSSFNLMLLKAQCLFFVCIFMFLSNKAIADGIPFTQVVVGGESEVKATEQRAIMWLRNGIWEIYIQPVFQRNRGSAAWVVPFPVKPTVHESSAYFFDDLELITSPVFIHYETQTGSHSSGGWCVATADLSGSMEARGGEGYVKVWEQGEVGNLEYLIISASEGENLGAWLNNEGFAIPQSAEELLSTYNSEGAFFFVARQSSNADPKKPIAPVRFVLPDMKTPSYPLRLTALGATEEDKLDLTVWMIFPDDNTGFVGFVPDSHPFEDSNALGYEITNIATYDSALDNFFAEYSSDTFIALAALDYDDLEQNLNGEVCDYDLCVSFYDIGLEPPGPLNKELQEMKIHLNRIFRYQARLSASAMSKDLTFKSVDSYELPYAEHVFAVPIWETSQSSIKMDLNNSDCSVSQFSGVLSLWPLGIALLLFCLGKKLRTHR